MFLRGHGVDCLLPDFSRVEIGIETETLGGAIFDSPELKVPQVYPPT